MYKSLIHHGKFKVTPGAGGNLQFNVPSLSRIEIAVFLPSLNRRDLALYTRLNMFHSFHISIGPHANPSKLASPQKKFNKL